VSAVHGDHHLRQTLRRARPKAWCLLTVVDLADDGVIRIDDERGVERPRPLVADGALVGSVQGWSAW